MRMFLGLFFSFSGINYENVFRIIFGICIYLFFIFLFFFIYLFFCFGSYYPYFNTLTSSVFKYLL